MNTIIERVCQLERWLTNAGICCDCGAEINHDIDEPFASCSGCGKDFGEWTSPAPTIQALRIQIASTVSSTKEDWEVDCPINSPHHPSWLPSPQECDEYEKTIQTPIANRVLQERRARLLERIQEIELCQMDQPMNEGFDSPLQDARDELAAVESALGYPEAQEPIEANEPKEPEDDKSGNQTVPLQDDVQYPQASGGLQTTKVDSWTASSDGNAPKVGQEQEQCKPKHCPTCLCLYEHEGANATNPMQSCRCGG